MKGFKKRNWNNLGIFFTILLVGVAIFIFSHFAQEGKEVNFSLNGFYHAVSGGKIANVEIGKEGFSFGFLTDGRPFSVYLPPIPDSSFISHLLFHNVETRIDPRQLNISSYFTNGVFQKSLVFIIIQVFLGIILFKFVRVLMGSGFSIMSNNSKDDYEKPSVTFSDVVGMKNEKNEIKEFMDLMREPRKFLTLNCKMPKGAILYGPPGNGKTLLAKALAGESGANFFSVSGSEFIELFVGVGASRVRSLFEKARKNSPSVVFIDEIDALGKRGGHVFRSGGDSERESTINQLLVELDGFEERGDVVVILATNRLEDVDEALIRSGRIDRSIFIGNPGLTDRFDVLKFYLKDVKLGFDVDIHGIARSTIGFSRADLANLVNESKFDSVRSGEKIIKMHNLERAKDKIMVGNPGRKSEMSEKEIRKTAFHECGHAFMMDFCRRQGFADGLYKVTILPYGNALGFAYPDKKEETFSISKEKIRGDIQVALAGRLAEEIFFGPEKITTGCSSDLQQARKLAEHYVIYGMSDDYGLSFIGENLQMLSEKEKARLMDVIKSLIDELESVTREVLIKNKEAINRMAEILLELETLTGEEVARIIDQKHSLPTIFQCQSISNLTY